MAYDPPAPGPSPLARDHTRKRWKDDHPGLSGLNEQFSCDMCGGVWFVKATFMRHQAIERPQFIAVAAQKREAWEASRRRHRVIYPPVSKEKLAEMEAAALAAKAAEEPRPAD